MLEPYALKGACTVLRGGSGGNAALLPDPMPVEKVLMDRLSLRPTPKQYRAFCDHLCDAHSWYKHLPLLTGERFVVFCASDAGIGCLVAEQVGVGSDNVPKFTLVTPPEGPEFTRKNPRIHYSWKTTKEYRRRFGYLDYMWSGGPDEPRARDAGPPLRLPQRLEERCSFVLYPYVSAESFPESLYWRHQEAIAQLRAGATHPDREAVLEVAQLVEARDTAQGSQRQLLINRMLEASDALRAQEVQKIRRALTELDDWLLHGE